MRKHQLVNNIKNKVCLYWIIYNNILTEVRLFWYFFITTELIDFLEGKALSDDDVLEDLPVGTTATMFFQDLGPQLGWTMVKKASDSHLDYSSSYSAYETIMVFSLGADGRYFWQNVLGRFSFTCCSSFGFHTSTGTSMTTPGVHLKLSGKFRVKTLIQMS